MKYCSKCNREFPDTSRFCPECGGVLAEDVGAGGGFQAHEVKAEEVRTDSFRATENAAPNNFRSENVRTQNSSFTANSAIDRQLDRQIENHLVKAIIATLCCCMPFGVAAIVFAAQVKSKVSAGDYDGAYEASKKANLWGNLSIGVGALVQIASVLFMILVPLLTGEDIFADM